MFCFDGKALYYITSESAGNGLAKYVESKLSKRYSSSISKGATKDIMTSTVIPKEYKNDKHIYVLSHEKSIDSKRITIEESGLYEDVKSVLFPLPHCKNTIYRNYTNFMHDFINDTTAILRAMSEKKLDCNTYEISINDIKFSSRQLFKKNMVSKILSIYFSDEYSNLIANDILDLVTIDSNILYLSYVTNCKPLLYAISRNKIFEIHGNSTWSASSIKNILESYSDIDAMDQQLTVISNRIYNMLFYNEYYWGEELGDPYDYNKEDNKFLFKKTVDDIDFYPWRGMWISDILNVPIKDIVWNKKVDTDELLYCPTYKGHSVTKMYEHTNNLQILEGTYVTIQKRPKKYYVKGNILKPNDLVSLRLVIK